VQRESGGMELRGERERRRGRVRKEKGDRGSYLAFVMKL